MNLNFNKTIQSCCTWLFFGLLIFGLSPSSILASSSFDKIAEQAESEKHLTINNMGNCTVNIYYWKADGDVYYTTIQPGSNWVVTTYEGHKWRAVDTQNQWSNLLYDKHYMVNTDNNQTWNITPDYCSSSCDDVTSGGEIAGVETGCGNFDPSPITSVAAATGGSGAIEYQWMYSLTGCQNVDSQIIPGANSLTYDPGVITQTTYFFRCARRVGCTTWDNGESNCIKKTVAKAPEATVSKNDPTCGNNDGKFTFSFVDRNDRTNIEFSIDGGVTYPYNVSDITGSAIISNLASGSYDLYVRWGNDECPVSLGTFALTDGSQAPGTNCDDNNANTTNDVILADGCSCAGTVSAPIYDCPQLEANIGDACNDGNANTENDVVTANCGCAGTQINVVLPSILINSVVVNEADGTATLTVGIDQVSATDVVVDFVTNDGTANSGIDYVALAGSITIPAGQQSVTLTFDILEDTTDETDELFNVILSNPQGAVIVGGLGSVTILDNDDPAVPGGCAAAYTVDGNLITITGVTGAIKTVKVLDEGWNSVFTCDEWSSVCNSTETVTIPSCGTYYVQVQTYADWSTPICNLFETVVISDGCGTGVDCPGLGLNIGAACDDGNPATINDVVKEDCGCYGILVGATVDCPALNANIGDACDDFNPNTNNDVVQANCSCAGSAGPSTCGVTYTVDGKDILVENISGAIRSVKVLDENWGTIFACDDWSSQCGTTEAITVPSCGKYFLQVHTYADWNTTICDLFETVEINDGCGVAPIVPNVSIDDVVVNEADGTASLTIAIDQIIGTDVAVDYGTTNGTAIAGVDYTALNGSVTIPAGQQFVTVTFDILDDTTNETDEIFNVVLSNPQGAVISGNIGTVTILDNDVAGPAPGFDCPALGANIGDVCNDGDVNTDNDVIQADCSCVGTPVTGGADCTASYTVEGNLITITNIHGAMAAVKVLDASYSPIFSCDDWTTACNGTESIQIGACGTYHVQIQTYADWSTPICDIFETIEITDGCGTGVDCPGLGLNFGQACDDGNPNTINDVVMQDCGCYGTLVGATYDCPQLGANVGDACDDFNPNTQGDVVQADCSCAGVTAAVNCNVTHVVDGRTITVNNIEGAVRMVKIIDLNWNTLYTCDSWTTPCGDDVSYTVEACGTYYLQVQTYIDWNNPICNIFETIVIDSECDGGAPVGCDNVTDGGAIAGDETLETGTAASPITNAQLPSGGSGTIEYIWLSATDGCPRFLSDTIPGAYSSTYDPGVLNETTYFIRCSRRADCAENTDWEFGESNCVVKEVVAVAPNNVCADRIASDAQSCRTGVDYGIWLQGEPFTISDGKFVEFNDGTALFTAHANGIGAVEVRFSGRTIESLNPKNVICGDTVSTNGWYFYASFEGIIGSHTISQRGPSFQVGVGANQQNKEGFGACAWFDTHDGLKGDINIILEGDAIACMGIQARTANTIFNAQIENGQVELDWTNNTGSVTDNFEVERSVDGVSFETIGTYDVVSLDDTPRFYSTEDGSPLTGFNYYRLKVNYLDGSFEYSEIRNVKISDIEEFGLFPNPARQYINVSLKGYTGKDISIQLIDQMGQAVKSIQLENVEDNNYTIDLNGLTNGMYSCWIFAEGTKPVGKKMIVNKQY